MCLPKEKGGLGIKDINTFNLALLGRWRSDLFQHQGELWARILDSKYGGWRCMDDVTRGNNESLWWQDLKAVFHQSQQGNVFQNGIANDAPLITKYPKLYHIFWAIRQKQLGMMILLCHNHSELGNINLTKMLIGL